MQVTGDGLGSMAELKFLCCRASDCLEKVGINGHKSLDEDLDHFCGAVPGRIAGMRTIAEFLATIGA